MELNLFLVVANVRYLIWVSNTSLLETESHRLINVSGAVVCCCVNRCWHQATDSPAIWTYHFVSICRLMPLASVRCWHSHWNWVCRDRWTRFRFDSDATNRMWRQPMDISYGHHDNWIHPLIYPIRRFVPGVDLDDRISHFWGCQWKPYSIGQTHMGWHHSWWSCTCLLCLVDNPRPPDANRPNGDKIPGGNLCMRHKTNPRNHDHFLSIRWNSLAHDGDCMRWDLWIEIKRTLSWLDTRWKSVEYTHLSQIENILVEWCHHSYRSRHVRNVQFYPAPMHSNGWRPRKSHPIHPTYLEARQWWTMAMLDRDLYSPKT